MKRKLKKKRKWFIPKPIKKADGIFVSDIHLQESVPVARIDDFWNAQWEKLDFISELQKWHECPVINAGDLYDFWKPSPMLLSKTMEHLPDVFWTIYGQHDLPQHNNELAYKSGIYCLEKAKALQTMPCMGGWGLSPEDWKEYELPTLAGKTYFVWHHMTYQGKNLFPGSTASNAAKLLRKYPQYDLIITGDNHKPFVEKHEGRLLVNPGSLFRTTAAQKDHKPRVYLWFADTNTVEPVYLPINENAISREHIEQKEERDNRINSFIETLNEDWQAEMSFEDNVEEFCAVNNIKQPIIDIIQKAIEDEKT